MAFINTANGHIQLSSTLTIQPNANYDELVELLKQHTFEYVHEDRYNLFQYIIISRFKAENKLFHFDIHFDMKKLKSISFGFTCDAGFEESYETWLANLTGTQTDFAWGTIELGEHPKYNVPFFNMQYK
ncbi:MAG: hypothetical protein U0U67_08100 [Chitinophagales bacterium]